MKTDGLNWTDIGDSLKTSRASDNVEPA